MKRFLAGLLLATTSWVTMAQSLPSPKYNAVTASSVAAASVAASSVAATGAISASSVAASTAVQSPSVQTNLAGWPGQPGTQWQSQYHANWNVVQSQIPYNPTEWQVYPNAANGIVQTVSGTNQVVLQSGTPFSTAWANLPYLYINGTQYKVATVTDTSHLTVQTTTGGAVSFASTATGTYYFVATTTTSTVNVAGTAVTYQSGQPFVSIYQQVFINGTAYTATYSSPTSLTLSTSAGTLTNATLVQYGNINNELSVLRLQGLNGANEENFAITERPDGTYLQSLYAGQGQYRPIFFSTGENPAGTISPLMSMYPAATIGNAGFLALGGNGQNQAVQVNQNYANVNHVLMQGAITGVSPSIAVRGSDPTVGLGFDVQGANNATFTSHSFGNTEFQVFGIGGSSWLAVGSSASDTPTLSANGADNNIGVNVQTKGTGLLQVNNGPIPLASGGTGAATALAATANLQTQVTGTGSIVRSVQSKLAEHLSVCDFGACGQSTDVSTAFQNAVTALPAAGGRIDVPDGAYIVNTAPTWGTKSVYWNIGPNAVITGTQITFPRMFTNGGIPAVGPFIQSQSAVASPAGDATCVMCVESLPPASLNGGVIASYAGTNLLGSGSAAIATAQNLVATAQNGSSGNIWGQEIDVGMYAPTGTGTQFGLSLNGLGSGNPTFGIKMQRADSSLWQMGIDIRNAVTGILIENTTGMTNGLVVGTIPTTYAGTTAMIGQMANSGSALILQRYTNTSPAGYLINAINANNTGQLFYVDVSGNSYSAGAVSHAQQEIDKSYSYTASPASGATVTMATGTETAVIAPSATLATLSIVLPACTVAYDGSIARYTSSAAITALTVTATSGSVSNPPTSLTAGVGNGYICRGGNTTWYRLY